MLFRSVPAVDGAEGSPPASRPSSPSPRTDPFSEAILVPDTCERGPETVTGVVFPRRAFDPLREIAAAELAWGWTRTEVARAQTKFREGARRNPHPQWYIRLYGEMAEMNHVSEGVGPCLPWWARSCLLGRIARAPHEPEGEIGRAHV